jgi:Na+:H+ antiporter, NhaA family
MRGNRHTAELLLNHIVTPFEHFLRRATAGGIVLLSTTIITLILANSPWGSSLRGFWEQAISLRVGGMRLNFTPHLLVNDGLMTFFFLLVGLELKREILVGELSSIRDAALPVVAALGGMIFPALLYYAFNREGSTVGGWGIPMATDIAFAVGILVLLAWRVPRSLILFLTALAIADDIGAVVVIALFYTHELHFTALAAAAGVLAFLLFLNRGKVNNPIPYVLGGIVLWVSILQSGIHATMAGILLACTIPARSSFTSIELKQHLGQLHLLLRSESSTHDTPRHTPWNPHIAAVGQSMGDTARAVQPLLERMEHSLDPWVTFLVIPIFAFSNADIDFGSIRLGEALMEPVTLGIVFGLVAGKFLGISLFSWLAVKLRIGTLPAGVSWWHLMGVAWLGGIGFTMSLFISQLAFADPALREYARLGILLASALSATVGIVWLYIVGLFNGPQKP